jgi:hypothetical protein
MSIKHIEDLKPQVLLGFLKTWNFDQKKFDVSEKIDGSFMSFGLKEGRFYVRSKNKIFFEVKEIPNIFYMQNFKRYFELLKKVPLDKIARKLSKEYNGSIDIEGEMVPCHDHNIVIYDEKKIGNGIFVIFGATIENANLANEINKHTLIKVYSVPQVDLSNFKFDNELIVSLEEFIKEHGSFLKKPARKPEAKELKQKLLVAIKEMGIEAKQQIIRSDFKSLFGEEYEGLVIKTPVGELIKIVDKDIFTKRREQNWHFIDMLQKAQRVFRKTIKANPENIGQALEIWKQELEKIRHDFKENKDKFFTIPKREQDTRDFIALDTSIINSMEKMLKDGADPPQEITRKYQQKEISPSS